VFYLDYPIAALKPAPYNPRKIDEQAFLALEHSIKTLGMVKPIIFLASQCRDCPFRSQCRDGDANPKGHRSVFISDYHVYLRAGDTFNHTPTGRALLASRWRVEPTVAWLVRYQGCRWARRVGQVVAQCQLYQACAIRTCCCGWRVCGAGRHPTRHL